MAQPIAIGGKLARVYFTLLKSGRPMGVREVQRAAGLSSPGSAKYYLDKLVELGFAERKSGEYEAKVNKDSVLSVYMGLLGSIVPRLIPYAIFCTVLLVAYTVLVKPPLLSIAVAAIPTALLWAEGIRLTKLIRKFLKEQ